MHAHTYTHIVTRLIVPLCNGTQTTRQSNYICTATRARTQVLYDESQARHLREHANKNRPLSPEEQEGTKFRDDAGKSVGANIPQQFRRNDDTRQRLSNARLYEANCSPEASKFTIKMYSQVHQTC